jgi:hypothetical protein
MSEDSTFGKLTKQTRIALGAGIAAVVVFPLLTLGRAIGLWETPIFLIGLTFLVTIAGMLTAIILGLKGILKREGRSWDDPDVRGRLGALALGVIIAIPVISFLHLGFTSPPIHDITTDTTNPPKFVSLLAEREATNAPNSAEYDPQVGEQQRVGYPDLGPLDLPVPADQAFRLALEAVGDMGWRLAAAVPEEGRVEAVDVTFWSGFVDDVVIRLTPISETETRVDVRSLSRVGGSDVGKNAARIREYIEHLN